MTSPLPPKRRDTRDSADLIRQLKQNARQLDSGLLGGRWSPAKPLGATAQMGDFEDDDPLDDDQPAAWNLDQITATTAGQVSLTLTYVPIDGTLLVFWDGMYLHPSEYVLAGQRVTFTNRHVHVGHRLEAAYWYWPGDVPVLEPLDSLVLRGASASISGPIAVDLPVGTQIGDLIVAANATMRFDGTPGTLVVTDPRLTQVSHNTWVGIATDLSPVTYSNDPTGENRHTGCVATFVAPVFYLNSAETGPAPSGTGLTMTAPTVAAAGAVLVVTEDNASSIDGTIGPVPAGYLTAVDPNTGSTSCKAGIYYWPPDGAAASPGGTITYTAHDKTYATAVGLQGES